MIEFRRFGLANLSTGCAGLPQPESGWPEAALAGALGVQLRRGHVYDGVLEVFARLGVPITPCSMALIIPLAWQVMGMAYGILFMGTMGWMMW
ncbi:MAG: hypothetical protein WBO24_05420 [Nitrospirales bacterium]